MPTLSVRLLRTSPLHATSPLPFLTGLSAPATGGLVSSGLGPALPSAQGFSRSQSPHSWHPCTREQCTDRQLQVIKTALCPTAFMHLFPLKPLSFLVYCLSPSAKYELHEGTDLVSLFDSVSPTLKTIPGTNKASIC